MKAFLLAAGYGTRLKPITDNIPKCLVEINGQPLLGWWLKLLVKHNVSEVLINTHYLPEKVIEYVENFSKFHIKVSLVHEERLLGSGGTIKKNVDFLENDELFLICYADNLTCVDISKLILFHRSHKDVLTMGLFYTNNPGQCGIASMNSNNVIDEFVEKPANPKSNLANAGIYVASKKLFDYFPNQESFDFGHDVLPRLVNKMQGYVINEYLLDIGTIANYKKANEEWRDDYI